MRLGDLWTSLVVGFVDPRIGLSARTSGKLRKDNRVWPKAVAPNETPAFGSLAPVEEH